MTAVRTGLRWHGRSIQSTNVGVRCALRSLIAVLFGVWVGAFATSAWADSTSVTLDAPVSGSIASGTSAVYSFDAAPGQRVYLDVTATSNAAGLNWFLDDAFGRRIVANLAALADLGPVSLMGGSYLLTIQGEAQLASGTFSFEIVSVEDDALSGAAGAVLAGSIDEPGERDTFALAVPANGSYLLDLLAASNASGINWMLADTAGNTFVAKTTALVDSAPLQLPAGGYVLEVSSEGGAMGTYSFRLAQGVKSSEALTLGQVVSAAISSPQEEDVYAFTIASAQEVFFDFQASSNAAGVNWQIEAADGLVMSPFGTNLADGGPFGLVPGDYRLRLRGEGDETPTYQFALVSPTHTTLGAALNQVISTGISVPGSSVELAFTAAPGQAIAIQTQSTTNATGLNYILRDDLGRTILAQTSSLAFHGPFALLGGEYTLTIVPEAGSVGNVTLRLVPTITAQAAMAIGATVSGVLANPGDTATHRFTGAPGQIVALDFKTSSNAAGLNWLMTDALGRVVLPRTTSLVDSAPIALMGGTYTLSIVGENAATGTYEVELDALGFSTFVPTGRALELGELRAGAIAAGAEDGYVLELLAPELVFFDLQSGDEDLEWTLTDSAGKALFAAQSAEADRGDDQGPFSLAAGVYRLSFSDPTGAAAYAFRAAVPDSLDAPLALDEIVSGAPALPGFTHAYTLDLVEDTEVYFEVSSGGDQLFWELADSAQSTVFARVAARSKMVGSQGPFVLAAGSYTLSLNAGLGQIPSYEFRVVEVEHETTPIGMGDVVEGSFGGPGETRTFTFTVPPGASQLTYFDVLQIPVDPDGSSNPLAWSLQNAAGQALFGPVTLNDTGADDQGPLALPPGAYALLLDAAVGSTPTYSFRVSAPSVVPAALAIDQPVLSAIGSFGDVHVHELSLGAPAKLYFDNQLVATTARATLKHLASGWMPFAEVALSSLTGADRGPHVLPAGDYTLSVTAIGGATPAYQVELSSVTDLTAGNISLNQILGGQIPSAGGTLTYTVSPTSAGMPLTFDLLSISDGMTWSLLDPVGTALFLDVPAANWATHDRGPFPLALGAYTLVLDANADATPEFQARVKAPEVIGPIPSGCAACRSLDAVFVFDTSASMVGEAEEVCSLADELEAGLAQQGVPVDSEYWGITDTANIPCLTSTVLGELGPIVPLNPPPGLGALDQCASGGQPSESWAGAASVVAGSYPWTDDAARLIVTLSDEGPWCGDGLNQDDELAIHHAVAVASAFDVVVSTVVPASVSDPLIALGQILADGTNGTATVATFEPGELESVIAELANEACSQVGKAATPELVEVTPLPGTTLPAGVPVVLSGRVVPVNALRPIVGVLVDGAVAPVYDAGGHFFATIVLEPGQNEVVLGAVEECGTLDTSITYVGAAPSTDPFSTFTDVTPAIDAVFSGTSFDRAQGRLLFDVAASTQAGSLDGPILMALGPELHPSISLVNADGVTPDGLPYVTVVTAGEALVSGESVGPLSVALDDPERRHADFSIRWLAPANAAPFFTSAPSVQAAVDSAWTYLASAEDPNGHPVALSLLVAPVGMSLSGANPANIAYTPTAAGSYQVVVRASDGRGGVATQAFTLAASVAGANQPPTFQSYPSTHVSIGAAYAYDADATDADGDALSYSIAGGPPWLAMDALTGLVSAPLAFAGNHAVTLAVADGNGGSAEQTFSLSVGEPSANVTAPVIVSTPKVIVGAEALYLYDVTATDADGGTLGYALPTAPLGMTIGAGDGVVRWVPTAQQVGSHPVTVQVVDGAGGGATQSYTLTVALDAPNQAPFFVTTPPLTAVAGTPYTYLSEAIDPEFEALTYALASGPSGMRMGPAGSLTWTPNAAQAGSQRLVLEALDPQQSRAIQSFSVLVKASNQPPAFTTTPAPSVLQGGSYHYAAKAPDPDGDSVVYAFVESPLGSVVYSTHGLVSWSAVGAAVGSHAFTLRATDGYGGVAEQRWAVEVLPDAEPPSVSVLPVKVPVCIGELGSVCVNAYDASGVAARTLALDGVPMLLNPQGCVSFTRAQPSLVSVVATAQDAFGNGAEARANLQVVDCNDEAAPVVTLQSPLPGLVAFAPLDVIATITDNSPEVLTWEVRLGPAGEALRVIASGTGAVDAATVASIDTTLLHNGQYRVQIEASDGLQTGVSEVELGVAGDYKLGNFTVSFVDLVLPVAGIPLSIGRTYDTLDAEAGLSGDVGVGWHLTLSGDVSDTEAEASGTGGGLGILSAEPYTLRTRVYVTKPNGERVGFSFAPKSKAFPAVFQYVPHFEPDPGVTDTLEAEGPTTLWAFSSQFMDYIIPYNPNVFVLTTVDKVAYTFDEELGLTHVEDANGNTLDVTPAGVVSSTGVTLVFERDALGRIVTVIEPADSPDPPLDSPLEAPDPPGELRYAYDAQGNLVSFTDQTGVSVSYVYDDPAHPGYLTEVIDPLGRPIARNVYGDDGRILGLCTADGDPVTLEGCATFDFDAASGLSTTFDARGSRTDRLYDEDGNAVVVREFLDDGSSLDTFHSFDAEHREIRRVDPDGNQWSWAYDAQGRKLSETDPSGATWAYAYGACETPEAECDPLANCTTRALDAQCNPLRVTDALGQATTYTYESNGRLATSTDALGGTWSFTYDATGYLASITDPAGVTATYRFNALGEMLERTDRKGQTVRWAYDEAHRAVSETWQSSEPFVGTWSYTPTGQLEQMSDPYGTWHFTYWPTGALRTINNAGTPGAPLLELSYGSLQAGQLVTGWDGNGNVTHVGDSLGGLTEYVWNERDRLVGLRQSGAGVDAKRVDLEVDGAGLPVALHRFADLGAASPVASTKYVYTCGGCPSRLSGLVHAQPDGTLLGSTLFDRNAALFVTGVADAEGSHALVHDGAHRLLSVDHPSGGMQPDEAYAYDAAGNRQASHLSALALYASQPDRAGHRLLEDDAASYGYDLNGNLVERTDKTTGERRLYTYDFRDRLVAAEVLAEDGAVLHTSSYEYALNDLRTRLEEDGDVRYVLHDGANPVLLVNESGQVTTRRLYLRSMDRIVAEETQGATRWLLPDVMGTVRDVIDDEGSVLAHYAYDSFGRQLAGPTPNVDDALRFVGREFGAAHGLGFFRARWYDPALGRFTQEDALPPWDYAYARSSPYLFSDATGRVALIEFALEMCSTYDLYRDTKGLALATGEVFDEVTAGLQGEAVNPDAITLQLLDKLAGFVSPDLSWPCAFQFYDHALKR